MELQEKYTWKPRKRPDDKSLRQSLDSGGEAAELAEAIISLKKLTEPPTGIEEWSLRLFPDGKEAAYPPNILKKSWGLVTGRKKIALPFIVRPRKLDIAQHLIQLKKFEQHLFHPSEVYYYNHKANYAFESDAEFCLIYEGFMDWEPRTEAFFLNGEFVTGRMATKGGMYTEDFGNFKRDLSDYFKSTQEFGLPKFGEYTRELLTNSNLPIEIISSFRDLTK